MTHSQGKRVAPLVIGTRVPYYGKIAAIGHLQGERYYWMLCDRGGVSMMPADVIEGLAKGAKRGK